MDVDGLPDAPMSAADDPDLAAACRKRSDDGVDGRRRRPRVSLAWVITADGLQHVSTWAHLRPRERPRNTKTAPRAVTCPVCERPVVIRIPKWKAHHAAHAPGDPCPVTQPETALHFNLKCLIAAQLEAAIGTARPLRIREMCFVGHWGPGWGRRYDSQPPEGVHRSEWLSETPCDNARERVWLEGWDRVELERRVGDERAARVPDVVLYRGGEVVGAVEVFHSNAVEDAKAAVLAAFGVPWIEVRAHETLLAGEEAWVLDRALPAFREGPACRWRCAAHEAALRHLIAEERRRQEAERRRAEAAREAARHTRQVRAVKLVDLLYPSGKQWRNIYWVVEVSTDGAPHSIRLERGDKTLLALPLGSAPKLQLWFQIETRVAADVRGVEAKRGAKTDSPMTWAKGPLAERMARLAQTGRWQRAPLERTHPVRFEFHAQSGEWRVREELRGVTWDRPADDPLTAPHPAWTPRSLVREGREAGGMGPTRRHRLRPLAAPVRARVAREPVRADDLGPAVSAVVEHPAAKIYELRRAFGEPERVIVVAERPITPDEAWRIDGVLAASGVGRLWLSRREHWTRTLGELPWLPLVAGVGGGHAVPINGYAVSLTEVAAAFAAGAPDFAAETVVALRHAERLPA